jgi:hypothetical protein
MPEYILVISASRNTGPVRFGRVGVARDPQVSLHTLEELSLEGSCAIMLALHSWINIGLV